MAHAHSRTLLAKLGFGDQDRKEPLHDKACRYLCEDAQARRLVARFGAPMRPGTRVGEVTANLEVALSKGENTYKTTIGFIDTVIRSRSESLPDEKLTVYWHDPAITACLQAYGLTKGVDIGALRREWLDASEKKKKAEAMRAPNVERLRTEEEHRARAYRLVDPIEIEARETTEYKTLLARLEAEKQEGLRKYMQLPIGTEPWSQTSTRRIVCVEVKIQAVGYSELLRQINLYREYEEHITDDGPAPVWVAAVRFAPDDAYVRTMLAENVHVVRLGKGFDEWLAKDKADDRPAVLEEI